MKKTGIILGLVVILGVCSFLYAKKQTPEKAVSQAQGSISETAVPSPATSPSVTAAPSASGFQAPLDRATERVTKKMFGTYVTPQNSPVQPERFSGYHTGADFETFSDEKDKDVQVHAVCDGRLILKEYASGYGGVMVQSCQLNGAAITVVYGHMRLASISHNAGDEIKMGDLLGVLGTGYSSETDGERKHLHLGFHKGTETIILGYSSTKAGLDGWLDPCLYACKN